MTRVVVVGGGLAGITAALDCADAGCEVTLIEARPRLGGLTYSFRRDGRWIDNGQHVFLRCCTAYRRLLERLGVADQVHLQRRLDIPVLRPGAPASRLRRNALPAPLHLGGSLLTYRALSLPDRLRAAWGALALARVDRDDHRTDTHTFDEWLASHAQNPATVAALWDVVGIATLNARADEASLALAATVFQLGLLTDAAAGDVGWSRIPLQQLHGDAAARAFGESGVELRTSAKVTAARAADRGWDVVTDTLDHRDGVEHADAVVLAVPPATAERLLPTGALALPAGWADRLGTSPIVNVHVRYDRRVLDEPFAATVGTVAQWIFDRTQPSAVGSSSGSTASDEQYLAVSISAADDLIDVPAAEITAEVTAALARLLPRAARADVLEAFVTRERHATFRPRPGTAVLRPGPTTTAPGLFLAGAWTATGWPATMEGAVRSGSAAAHALLGVATEPTTEAVAA